MTETRNTAQPAVWAIRAEDLPQHSQFRKQPEERTLSLHNDFMSFDDLKLLHPEMVESKLPPRKLMTDDVI